jgi:hypothetical protein
VAPTAPTFEPTYHPTHAYPIPTPYPTATPTSLPSPAPSSTPSSSPSGFPTSSPTWEPTAFPTGSPTPSPTPYPTTSPTPSPTSCDPVCTWEYTSLWEELELLHNRALALKSREESLHAAHRAATLAAMDPSRGAQEGHSTSTVVLTTLVTVVASLGVGMALEGWRVRASARRTASAMPLL